MFKEYQTILVFFKMFNIFYDYRVINVHHREFKIYKNQEKNKKHLERPYVNQNYTMNLTYISGFQAAFWNADASE